MKLRTMVVAAGAVAAGYLFGTRAGRARWEQIKGRATEVAQDPRVQAGVSTVAGEVARNAHYLPTPASSVVRGVAERVESATKSSPAGTTTSAPSTGAPPTA